MVTSKTQKEPGLAGIHVYLYIIYIYLVLLKVISILGLTKVPFGDYFLFLGGFLSKSKYIQNDFKS